MFRHVRFDLVLKLGGVWLAPQSVGCEVDDGGMASHCYNGQWRLSRRSVIRALGAVLLGLATPGYAVPQRDVIGELRRYSAKETDTFVDVARRFGLGYAEMVAANPSVDPWVPALGVDILLPTAHVLPKAQRNGIVINLAQQRLFFFPSGETGVIATFPIGIGRDFHETRLGETYIAAKRVSPVWIPPPSVRRDKPYLPKAVGPGPGNPLGDFALNLAWPLYVIHGTNQPYSIGRRVSYGCVRLYPEDIEKLFRTVTVGTVVTVVDQPVLLGWLGKTLCLEVHPTQQQSDELVVTGQMTPTPADDLLQRISDAVAGKADRVDWRLVDKTVQERRGVPVSILQD